MNQRKFKWGQYFLFLSFVGQVPTAWSWGRLGHQTIATVASTMVPGNSLSFWSTNSQGMGILTNVPDVNWKMGASASREKPNHWFQPDSYFSNASQFSQIPHAYADALKKYSESSLTENGTAPWRIKQLYDLSVAAFKDGDFATGLEMAGTMSHYIGDLSQPLHVTKNYDGQETHDEGIHKFFETDILNSSNRSALVADVTAQAKALLANADFKKAFNGSVIDATFAEIDRAYALKDQIISIDIKKGRGPQGAAALLAIAKARMADGAATLAMILSRLSQEAKLANNGRSVSVGTPDWVPPDFSNPAPSSVTSDLLSFIEEDDCYK